MARTFTPIDQHTLMNLLLRQATGEQSLTVTDTSTFISAGELVLSTGMENVYNAINIVANGLDITWFYQGVEDFKKVTLRNLFVKFLFVACLFIFMAAAPYLE